MLLYCHHRHLHSLLCWLWDLGAWIWAEWELWGFWCQSDFKLDHNILSSRCGEYILTMLVLQLGHELNTKSVNYKFWKVINLPIYESSTHRVLVKTKYEKSPIYSIIFSSCFFIIILKREIEWWPNVRNTRLAMEGVPVPPRVSPLHPFLRSLPSRKVSPPVASPTIDGFRLI